MIKASLPQPGDKFYYEHKLYVILGSKTHILSNNMLAFNLVADLDPKQTE